MLGLANNLLRIGAAHPQTTSWGTSLVVNGAVVAGLAWFGGTDFETPQLPGRQTNAQVELVTSWTEPELPSPVVEIAPPEPRVIVRRDSVVVGEKTYKQSPTDVSDPTPEEIALVEDMLPPLTDAASRREPTASPSAEEPPTREIPRESRPARVAVVSIPQDQSVGTSADVLPKMLDNRPPDYPHRAFVERREGTVMLRILITAEGDVGNLEIAASSGHPILDAAAVQAIRSWRFEPARRFGRPIPYTVRLPVRFALD